MWSLPPPDGLSHRIKKKMSLKEPSTAHLTVVFPELSAYWRSGAGLKRPVCTTVVQIPAENKGEW